MILGIEKIAPVFGHAGRLLARRHPDKPGSRIREFGIALAQGAHFLAESRHHSLGSIAENPCARGKCTKRRARTHPRYLPLERAFSTAAATVRSSNFSAISRYRTANSVNFSRRSKSSVALACSE